MTLSKENKSNKIVTQRNDRLRENNLTNSDKDERIKSIVEKKI